MTRGPTPLIECRIECPCGEVEIFLRHAAGRKRIYCRKCIADRKRKYDREMQRQARNIHLTRNAKPGAF